MKSVIKNYTFSTVAKTITLTDISTVRLDKLALITDTTTNKILYNFADSTVATATVATNVITLSTLQGGENNADKLRIDYDVESTDTSAFADATTPVSAVSATFDHGSNRDVDTSAEQITSTSFACKFGVTLKADITNTGILYIGNSDVTAGTTAATDGFPLSAGETLTLEVTNSNIPYAIASANNQIIYWTAV